MNPKVLNSSFMNGIIDIDDDKIMIGMKILLSNLVLILEDIVKKRLMIFFNVKY